MPNFKTNKIKKNTAKKNLKAYNKSAKYARKFDKAKYANDIKKSKELAKFKDKEIKLSTSKRQALEDALRNSKGDLNKFLMEAKTKKLLSSKEAKKITQSMNYKTLLNNPEVAKAAFEAASSVGLITIMFAPDIADTIKERKEDN